MLNTLREKADIFNKNRRDTWYILFSKSGFTDAVKDEAQADKHIILVDLYNIIPPASTEF